MKDPAHYPGDLLEHLRALATLATVLARREHAPFARTAQELALDVSVLRRRIHGLERHFARRILAGRADALALTPHGAHIASEARRILAILARLHDHKSTTPRRLRIGCTGTVRGDVLPPILALLRARFADLELVVLRSGAHASLDLLRKEELDFAVIRAESRPNGLHTKLVGKDRLWLAARKGSPLARARTLTPRAMATAPLIGYAPPSFTMDRVLAVLAPLGREPWIEVQGKAAALSYAAAGLGIAFVSLLSNQKPAHRGVVMRDVTAAFAPASFWLVWKKEELAPWERALANAF